MSTEQPDPSRSFPVRAADSVSAEIAKALRHTAPPYPWQGFGVISNGPVDADWIELMLRTPPPDLPTLLTQAVITPYQKTDEGELVRAVYLPLRAIIEAILKDPASVYQIDPRKWEEIIAASYEQSRQFDRVTLTHRSGDGGRDLIVEKDGYGSVRLIESVKRYKPGHEVKAAEVRDLVGVLTGDRRASKGIISTTWRFAPRIDKDSAIGPLLPTRLELVEGEDLFRRLNEYTRPRSQ